MHGDKRSDGHRGRMHKRMSFTIPLVFPSIYYEENISMARGKPQKKEMTAEINSNLRYDI